MDSEQQFTPGPWEIDRESFNNPAHDDKFCAIRAEFEGETWVVAEVCGDVAQLQPEANARLIATAPELYGALQSLIESLGSEHPGGLEFSAHCEDCQLVDKAKAILAKVSVPRATAA